MTIDFMEVSLNTRVIVETTLMLVVDFQELKKGLVKE